MDLSYFSNHLQDYSLYKTKPKFDLTLHRIERALKEIGSSQNYIPPTIHVAGTNGKCSTISFMKAILESKGLRVHVYTSPHLVRFNERIVLAGQEISDDAFLSYIQDLTSIAKKHDLSWFEFLTLIAFQAFRDVPADVLLLETGLGGEFDATNVVTAPIACVITPISYDHLDYLGSSLTNIARAKAGIIKPSVPVFSAVQEKEVMRVLHEKAGAQDAPLFAEEQDWSMEYCATNWLLKSNRSLLALPYPSKLRGRHQVQNAALAIAALKAQHTLEISEDHLYQGLESAYCPGRLMQINNEEILKLFPDGTQVWFDGAHNPAAAQVVAKFFEEKQSKPLYIICGLLQSKDAKAFLAVLQPLATEFIFIPIESHPACYQPAQLKQIAQRGKSADNLKTALSLVAQQKGTEPLTVLICGSFYLAAAFI